MSEDNNNEEFIEAKFPLPENLTFKTLVEASLEMADKIGDILHGQEQVLAICSLVLVMKRGLSQAQRQMVECIGVADDDDMKIVTDILAQAVMAEESLTKFLAIYPSLRIGAGYKKQVSEYFSEDDDDDPKKRKDALEIPTSKQMEELYEKLFTPDQGDDE